MERQDYLLKNYGITEDDYNRFLVRQEYKCGICGREKEKLHVDHNHKTGKVRGLLCNKCNLAIGQFGDDIQTLQKAIFYLRFHKRKKDAKSS